MLESGEVISYREMCDAERASLQRGMNYKHHGQESVLLMSVRSGAPYHDHVEDDGRVLVYEGHDVKRTQARDPKTANQPMREPSGKLTQNGQFWEAARRFQSGKSDAEIVRVYEKIKTGIWVFNGVFRLVDAGRKTPEGEKYLSSAWNWTLATGLENLAHPPWSINVLSLRSSRSRYGNAMEDVA